MSMMADKESSKETFVQSTKGLAIITEIKGIATIKDTKKKREITVTDPEEGISKTYLIPYGSRIKVMDGSRYGF